MELEHRSEGNVLVVTLLEKRLDARSASPFKDKMVALIDEGHSRIVLDIREIEFIDSSGLGVIVAVLKQLAGQGDLVICGARDTVRSMFKLTRLDKVFQMFTDVGDAVAALAR
ncbi:STAS domain-containing protein [Candidatus Binatia bacterium]|nr:STAS domain-containing protein [Candidatus Binatia bacterium]